MLAVYLPIFVVDKKITFVYNFVTPLKVHQCKFENLAICSNSYKNNTLKISHF